MSFFMHDRNTLFTIFSLKHQRMKRLLLLMIGLAIGYMAEAQTVVTGTIIDEMDQPLIGATVVVPETTQGTSTDVQGDFRLQVRKGTEKVMISYLNYKTLSFDIDSTQARVNLGTIKMEPEATTMEDVVITQSVAVQRKTPVAARSSSSSAARSSPRF